MCVATCPKVTSLVHFYFGPYMYMIFNNECNTIYVNLVPDVLREKKIPEMFYELLAQKGEKVNSLLGCCLLFFCLPVSHWSLISFPSSVLIS